MTETQQFWEDFYREREQVWTGRPNKLLVREVAGLAPGTALDIGSGEGGDAIWLAARGWRVTAIDVSQTALDRARAHAGDAGITWERHDLPHSFPAGEFDLVSAQFFHSPVAQHTEREETLRLAAKAVAPGGRLLVVGHHGWPSWLEHPPHDVHFPTTKEVIAQLELDAGWEVELEDLVETEMAGPDGQPGRRSDSVLRVRRLT